MKEVGFKPGVKERAENRAMDTKPRGEASD